MVEHYVRHPYADGHDRFHLRCEDGHNVVSSKPNRETCGVPLRADGGLCVTTDSMADADHFCEAEIVDRIIDYVPVTHIGGPSDG